MAHQCRGPPAAGHSYAWNIFTRPDQHVYSPRHPPLPWPQYHLQHPGPRSGTLVHLDQEQFFQGSMSRAGNTWSRYDGLRRRAVVGQTTPRQSPRNGCERRPILGQNSGKNSTQGGDVGSEALDHPRFGVPGLLVVGTNWSESCGSPNNQTRPFRNNNKFKNSRRPQPVYRWPSRMGEMYWEDHTTDFHGRQNLVETSYQDTRWTQTKLHTMAILFDSTDGKFYIWDGTRLCRERGPQVPGEFNCTSERNGHNGSTSSVSDNSVSDNNDDEDTTKTDEDEEELRQIEKYIQDMRETRKFRHSQPPSNDTSMDNSSTQNAQEIGKKVPRYSEVHKELMKRRDAQKFL